jgi:hypothetical protein
VHAVSSLLATLDEQIHDLMLEDGLAHMARYTAPGATTDTEARVYLFRNALVRGDFGQLTGRRDEMQIINGALDPRAKGEVFVEYPDKTGGERYVLQDKLEDDGSVSRWVVRHVRA